MSIPPADNRKAPRRRSAVRTRRSKGAGASDLSAPGAKAPRTRPARLSADDKRIRNFVIEAARLLHDSHCENIVAFEVRSLSDMTDYILIASGTSDRQIRAVSEDVEEVAKAAGL